MVVDPLVLSDAVDSLVSTQIRSRLQNVPSSKTNSLLLAWAFSLSRFSLQFVIQSPQSSGAKQGSPASDSHGLVNLFPGLKVEPTKSLPHFVSDLVPETGQIC